jgi:hypothetical protein
MTQKRMGSVLNNLTGRPVSYEVGETEALRRQIMTKKVATSISPTPEQKKPIPAVKRAPGAGRTF